MNENNDAEDGYIYEDACVNSVCDSMSPVDMLLSLTQECPLDCKSKSCPIKEIHTWRKMDLKQAYNHISALPLTEQRRLVEEHRKCSSVNPNNR